MRRAIKNSFGDDTAQNAPAPLPIRGTGLEMGAADERKAGESRSDEERAERHEAKFHTVVVEGTKVNRLEGYEPEPMGKKSNKVEDHWNRHREKYYLKK